MMNLFLLQAASGDANAGIMALCMAMAIGLLFYIFYLPPEVAAAPKKTRLAFLTERKDMVYENLRDLNFENKAGKISESDYQEMRTSLEEEAAALLAEIESLEQAADASSRSILNPTRPKGARL
jgi:hypothetical protein